LTAAAVKVATAQKHHCEARSAEESEKRAYPANYPIIKVTKNLTWTFS